LVFPSSDSASIVVQPKSVISESIAVPTNPPIETPPVMQFSHPAAIFNQFVVSLVDHSILKMCQDGDVATLSRYLALHHDKVSTRSLNAVDATGKVFIVFTISHTFKLLL
jgi:hypothetical protein